MASVETVCGGAEDGHVSLGKRRSRRAPSGAKRMKTRSHKKKSPIEKLPTEVLVAIFENMGNATMNICAMVCKRWRTIFAHYTADPPLWFGDITSIDGWIMGYIHEDNPFAHRAVLRARGKHREHPSDLIMMAVNNDSIRFLRAYFRYPGKLSCIDLYRYIYQAAFRNSRECLKYFHEKYYYDGGPAMYYAAMNGSLRSLKWLYDEIHHKIDTNTVRIAVEHGNT
ncbi:MAG: F-box-like domain-containing protein, partial [Pseudonocardiaceae bacterium]